ncbi:Phage tail sheath protein [Labrenzia sp. THAF191b]|uniref:phage tail sheath family protein n=1 Tax=unclassified Labrenzia TaxID=2648686 RepID=UPI001268E4BD|nr:MULTISPECIES: phage tail sheath family protein [unclassified Labrenzia]QFS97553.1 Phage tail sheath protein [Labrenzia sp. THAF191b]QFT03868.1 Phage tail sheath protein [Labrenzia sp. THAF191a]QFT15410.1 Phage tail sheath protein [Labrenzia sp. THAF187b]
MSAIVPNVGTRVFSDLTPTVASIDARQTYIGMCLPAPNADNSIEMHKPIAVSTEDSETIALLGDGVAKDAIEQIAMAGISTDIIFSRCEDDPDEATQLGHIAGSAASKTGVWALAEALSEIGLEPGLIIAPEFSHQRPGDAANPVVTAAEGVCNKIIDCFVVADADGTTRETAAASAADFATSLNILMGYPRVKIWKNGADATAPMSTSWAAQILKRDAEAGNPYKAAWNRPLVGIRGVETRVSHRDGDPTSDSNYLCQAGVGTIIENKLLWAPFTTATDPTVRDYRSIKRIRTRRSIEKAFIRAMRKYMAGDLGPHLATLIYQTISEACAERQAFGAIIDYEVIWDRKLNPNTSLRDGALKVKLRFEETPDLVDLQIFTEPQPEAFDLLAANIAQALEALGDQNIRVADTN